MMRMRRDALIMKKTIICKSRRKNKKNVFRTVDYYMLTLRLFDFFFFVVRKLFTYSLVQETLLLKTCLRLTR